MKHFCGICSRNIKRNIFVFYGCTASNTDITVSDRTYNHAEDGNDIDIVYPKINSEDNTFDSVNEIIEKSGNAYPVDIYSAVTIDLTEQKLMNILNCADAISSLLE